MAADEKDSIIAQATETIKALEYQLEIALNMVQNIPELVRLAKKNAYMECLNITLQVDGSTKAGHVIRLEIQKMLDKLESKE